MKKLVVIIMYVLLLATNTHITQATPVAPEVKRLYEAAKQGDAQGVERILNWHREQDKKRPATMLQQARIIAVADNDAPAAVVLTTRLKQEQMGSWERYFRGITLTATIAVVAGLIGASVKVYAQKQTALRSQVPSDYDIEDINSDGTLYERGELARSQANTAGLEREMDDFSGRSRDYPPSPPLHGMSENIPPELRAESKRSSN